MGITGSYSIGGHLIRHETGRQVACTAVNTKSILRDATAALDRRHRKTKVRHSHTGTPLTSNLQPVSHHCVHINWQSKLAHLGFLGCQDSSQEFQSTPVIWHHMLYCHLFVVGQPLQTHKRISTRSIAPNCRHDIISAYILISLAILTY
jgi:hypothetical protein